MLHAVLCNDHAAWAEFYVSVYYCIKLPPAVSDAVDGVRLGHMVNY